MGGRKRLTLEDARQRFSDSGFVLLAEEYINNTTYMPCRCSNGHLTEKSVGSLKTGCITCGIDRRASTHRLSFSEVKKTFEDGGCILLSTSYKNSQTPLDYICECGTKSRINLSNFKMGKRCNKCRYRKMAEKRRHSYEHVKKVFEERGCELLSNNYENQDTILTYRCKCGSINNLSFENFRQRKSTCRACYLESVTGENNVLYKPYLTEEHRLIGRNFKELRDWRKAVFERDDYTCNKCKGRGSYLNAHHKNSYDLFPELREDVDNGVTLCSECHTDFHKTYGYGANTEIQYNDWLSEESETGQAAASQFNF